ncbi:MAG TPA: hypothetical protein VE967_18295, partial [Gemmatimonadaceae bacterium]|nr:hypothetical protein [Gemmatimonadaceae bacterium]
FAGILAARRDLLTVASDKYYRRVAYVPDVHGTDADDRAVVTRVGDQYVDVRLETRDGAAYFSRRFDAADTPELRVYLHGGNDTAIVRGAVVKSILVRVIGGNGRDTLVDSSVVGRDRTPTLFYDGRDGRPATYGPDTSFRRVPWIDADGRIIPPPPDRGTRTFPHLSVRFDRNLGVVPTFTLDRYLYGFDRFPYARHVGLDIDYASAIGGIRIGVTSDKRFEHSPWHLAHRLRYSGLEQLYYPRARTDSTAVLDTGFTRVPQRQMLYSPTVGYSLGTTGDISLGPFVQFSQSSLDSDTAAQPYGLGFFRQAGMRLTVHHEARDDFLKPSWRTILDVSVAITPAMLDVRSRYEELGFAGGVYLILPLPTRPMLALRGGGKKLFGDFPFLQSAFVGGSTVRWYDTQRFAGDAFLYGSSELRVRVTRFDFFVPVEAGVVGLVDADRVYMGKSFSRWHTAFGAGLWVSLMHNPTTFDVALVDGRLRAGTLINTGLLFQ